MTDSITTNNLVPLDNPGNIIEYIKQELNPSIIWTKNEIIENDPRHNQISTKVGLTKKVILKFEKMNHLKIFHNQTCDISKFCDFIIISEKDTKIHFYIIELKQNKKISFTQLINSYYFSEYLFNLISEVFNCKMEADFHVYQFYTNKNKSTSNKYCKKTKLKNGKEIVVKTHMSGQIFNPKI